jgi:hypothetical protein
MIYQKEKLKSLKWFIMPLFMIGFFIFVNSTNATSSFPYINLTKDTNLFEVRTGVNPTPYIRFYLSSTTTIDSITLNAKMDCAGDGTGINVEMNGTRTGDNYIKDDTDIPKDVTITFTPAYEISPGWNFLRIIHNGTCSDYPEIYGISNNPYDPDTEIYTYLTITPGGDQIYLPYFYVSEESIINWSYDWFTLDPDYPDFYMPIQQVCFIDSIDPYCNLEYWYNKEAIDSELYFIYDNGQVIRPYNSATSTTVEYASGLQSSLYLTSQSEATTTPFCLFLENSEYGDISQCGYNIEWIDSSYFPEMPDGFCSSTTDPCSDIATTTFGGEIECGFRRLGQWAICPSDESLEIFNNTINIWERIPPYSLISQITNAFLDSTATSVAFSINITSLTGIDGYNTNMPLLEEGMMTNTWGSLWEMVYSLMEKVLWFFGFLTMLFIFLGQGTFAIIKNKILKKKQ